MVKNSLNEKKKRFGFSIVEAAIMLTVLAVVVASTTPIITRKLLNNSDIGAALGGGSHGRYEVYIKEVLTFGPNRTPENTDGTKTVDDFVKEKNPSAAQNTIIVYERKDKNFYKKMTGKDPIESTGKTSTLYEEIKGVTPVVNEDGTITVAKKNVGGKVETYVAGGKYIFEDGTYKYTAIGGGALDLSKNRIIEGNLTSKFEKNNPTTNNTLWELALKKEDSVGGGVEGYEIITDPNIKGELIVYEKKDDNQYKTLTGSAPAKNGDYKSTLYEEITDAKPIKDKDGTIVQAKIKINGKEQIIKEDSKYIFENPQVTYIKGVLKVVNGITTFIPDEKGKTIDRDKNRVIEGNFTERYSKNNPATNNSLWHIQASSNNFDGDVTTIPWEKVVSGSKDIVDRPLGQDSNGDYVGQFTPPSTAVNTVLHAVGGGGAGGGPSVSTLDAYVSPNKADSSEIQIMKKQLANRFREVAKKKGRNDLAGLSDDAIVKVVNNSNIGYTNNPSQLLVDDTYILINTSNGTITVKIDVTTGMILPHELLDYTKILGAQTQVAEIHDMPKWFDWQDITDGKFKAGAVACGTAGGNAGSLIWITTKATDANINCMKSKYGTYNDPCQINGQCTYKTGTSCDRGYDKNGKCKGETHPIYSTASYCAQRQCLCSDGTYYSCPDGGFYKHGWCMWNGYHDAERCNSGNRTRNNTPYTHTYTGGSGGAAPPCVWLGTYVKDPVTVSQSCLGVGYTGRSGSSKTVIDNMSARISASGINGENGATCSITVDNITSHSAGGTGGIACIQSQFDTDYSTPTYVPDDTVAAGCANTPGCVLTSSDKTMIYALAPSFMCQAMPTSSCGKNGKAGVATPGNINSNHDVCTFSDGTSVKCMSGGTGIPNPSATNSYGIGKTTGRYNYIYTWTIPYATNYLGYGEAGSAGEYATTKLSKIDGSLFIKLGKGGAWTNDGWKYGKKGPNGTDTIVRMGENSIVAKKVLVAKGGQGGRGGLKTNNYDLCYANDRDKACSDNTNIQCCSGIAKTSREVSATNVRKSIFDTIKSFVGNSKIIGIGLGRGAQGAGTASGEFEVYGSRLGINATADISFSIAQRIVYKKSSPSASTGAPEGTSPTSKTADKYKNGYLKPANVNFKGGDGAVIITW